MIEETEDPTTWITSRENDKIYYENSDGKRWWISGTCTACGECESFPDNFSPGMIINQVNIRKLTDNSYQEWIRILTWNNYPGSVGACTEEDYELRKDIPMTPNGVGAGSCTLNGEWIE